MSARLASSVGERVMLAVCTGQTESQAAFGFFVCGPGDDYPFACAHTANVADRNYLRAWREKKKLTQEELADLAGTTKAVISLLENEKRPLSSKWLRLFAAVLGTTPGRILDINPLEVDAEILEAWDKLRDEDRPRAVRLLRSLTGTDD